MSFVTSISISSCHNDRNPPLPEKENLSLLKRITAVVHRILGQIWSLPARYFGGKPSEGYSYQIQRRLSAEELKPYLSTAFLVAFIHGTDTTWIPNGWHITPPCSLEIADPDLKAKPLCFFDPTSGLKISVMSKDQELVVVFGAIGSSYNELTSEKEKRKRLFWDHATAANNLIGTVPAIYSQANAFFSQLQKHPSVNGKKITLAGQCYGGSIASYVALKNNIPAICLNSLALGAGLQQDIGDEALKAAQNHLTHIIVEGDLLCDHKITLLDRIINAIGIRTPGNFGKKFSIPSAYETAAETHSYTLGSILKHLGYDIRAKPWDIKN